MDTRGRENPRDTCPAPSGGRHRHRAATRRHGKERRYAPPPGRDRCRRLPDDRHLDAYLCRCDVHPARVQFGAFRLDADRSRTGRPSKRRRSTDWPVQLSSLIALPLMAVIAVLVKLDSPGPILFRQEREGLNGEPFMMLKFRTMYCRAHDESVQATTNDRRVTRTGYWLRRFSLDELPQLLNVLRGDMSLVGPRPHLATTRAGSRLFSEVGAALSGPSQDEARADGLGAGAGPPRRDPDRAGNRRTG